MKIKLMPESPETDLKKIEENVRKVIDGFGVKLHELEKQAIAFGLIALIITVVWPEEKDPDLLENALRSITDVQSVEITDVRRLL